MEFEKNKPVTAEDIALADAPKVTLQPTHAEVKAEPVNSNYTHENEATFAFETESTPTPVTSANEHPTNHPHRKIAAVAATAIVFVFGLALFGLYSLR